MSFLEKSRVSERYKNAGHKAQAVYLMLRVLVIGVLIREFFNHNYFNAFLCIISLFLFTIPSLVSQRFKIGLPDTLEIIVYCFIFAAEILGEIDEFYTRFPYWDTLLHTLNGFLCAAIGFSLVDILNRHTKAVKLTPAYLSLAAFCFSMTVGVCWEFFECTVDRIFRLDMQKDTIVTCISSVELNADHKNVPVILDGISSTEINLENGETYVIEGGYLDIGIYDTMNDLYVNLIGAATFTTFGYFLIRRRDKKAGEFAKQFIPYVIDDQGD